MDKTSASRISNTSKKILYPSAFLAGALIFCALIIFVTYQFSRSYFESQFKLIYNLDKKENDQQIVQVIETAHQYIYFAIYSFTESDIATALVKARERGLIVVGVMDASEVQETKAEASILTKLQKAGIDVSASTNPQGIMHAKIIVTDNTYALGSYNWTASATLYNDEVLEIGTDPSLREGYLNIVKKILLHNH